MRSRAGLALLALLAGAVAGCQEELGTPTDCPALCPGNSLAIRDTVLTPLVGLDSSYTGYISVHDVGGLLVSDGISGGEARTFAVFPAREDSIFVNGLRAAYALDSVGFVLNLIARDSTAHSLRLLAYRIPITTDTTTSFADLEASLTPANLIDSVLIADTLQSGGVTLVVKGTALDRIAPVEADSGVLGIGFRVAADVPTGVRLGSLVNIGAPVYRSWVTADVADTSARRQVYDLDATISNYVVATPPVTPPDLFLGGQTGSRALLRFRLPPLIKDSGAVVRATLELTPDGPLRGMPNDPGALQIRTVLADLGAKSPVLSTVSAVAFLTTGSTEVQTVDVRALVDTWIGTAGLTPAILLGLAPDGGTFARPEFFSSLSPNPPRLRITYALSSYPGHP